MNADHVRTGRHGLYTCIYIYIHTVYLCGICDCWHFDGKLDYHIHFAIKICHDMTTRSYGDSHVEQGNLPQKWLESAGSSIRFHGFHGQLWLHRSQNHRVQLEHFPLDMCSVSPGSVRDIHPVHLAMERLQWYVHGQWVCQLGKPCSV